jgi:thiol-disulfide isomerase/thioredoxin
MMLALAVGCAGTTAPPVEPVVVQPVSPSELDAAIAAHRGKVVLVDFWATWCTGCVAMLPHVVELHEKQAERGLVVVTVSMDDREDADKAARMLAKHGVRSTALISNLGTVQESFEAFDLQAIPTYRVYDREGALRHTLPRGDAIVPSDIDDAVEELLSR